MSSSSRCCATGVFVLPSLLLLPLYLSLVFGVQGATLREHRLSGTEPNSYGPASQILPPPSAEMLRALRYIQSLSQRTPSDPLADERRDQEEDDMESIRSMLQLAAPGRMDRGMEEREEERDNTQELLQAVLKTLQQTEEHMVPQKVTATQPRYAVSQKTPQKIIVTQPRYAIRPFPRAKQQLEVETSAENYGRTSWANSDSRRRHRQYPLMFEDEEDPEQPLKRTNENAEEQYTPQKLATLQSVFEELSGISTTKAKTKRDDSEDDDDGDDDDEDNDLYRQRKMVLEDIMGTDEWAPLEEQIETEEEERERHGFDRDLEDDDQEEEEEEDEDDVKRSNQSNWIQTGKEEEPEDIAKLVDYYLLQVLEKKEQEQQKRQEASKSEQESNREVEKKDVDEDEDEEDEEEEEEEREIKPMHNTFPESLSQIIKISQKLRIPPEEVLELLQNERRKDLSGIPAQSRSPYATAHNTHKTFAAAPHRRPIETSEGNRVAQDILNILELVNAAQQNDKRPMQPNTSRYYERETSKDDYDNTAGEEDELANYLASEMLAQGQRRPTPSRDEDQPVYGNFERAVQDYLDKSAPEKRTAEHQEASMGLDNNTMLKILRYLEPDSDNTDETDSEDKTVPEM